MNNDILDALDEKGYDVWLQVEPGNASFDELIHIVLNQYKDHPSIVGFGIDVEWYKSTGGPEGQPITDAEANRWVSAIRKYDRDYQLFLKHWDEDWMPPTVRDGIMFVNDSQQFESFDQLVAEFTAWGQFFAPPLLGFNLATLLIEIGGRIFRIRRKRSGRRSWTMSQTQRDSTGWTSRFWMCFRHNRLRPAISHRRAAVLRGTNGERSAVEGLSEETISF